MKKSTKILATVLAAATMLVGVVACSKSGTEGKYKGTMSAFGMDADITLELKGDDKCTMTVDMTDTMKEMADAMGVELSDEDLAEAKQSQDGTYAIDGDKITITFVDEESGEEEVTEGTIKDGKITITDESGEELVLKK